MSLPAVNLTELDGALGVLPASSGQLLAVVGACTSGPLNTPSTFGRPKDVISNFGGGAAVEAACHELELYGRPVCIVRTGNTVAGAPGTPVLTGVAGTSVVSLTGAPNDDYELVLKVIAGGTIGSAGIVFAWSLDGGRTYSPNTALGTATAFAIPGAGTLGLAFAAGTLIAGDTVTSRTTAPQWNSTELGTAMDALAASAVVWEIAQIVGPLDGTSFDLLETKITALRALGKYRAWIGHARVPTVGETEAAYATAIGSVFASKVTVLGMLCAGAAKITSSVSGRKYKRPTSFTIAARQATVSAQVDIADVNLGALPGVAIHDANGNPDEHDEALYPGLDDAKFCVLRTWEGEGGVFVNRPRLFSSPTSDFQLMPHRRVLNIAEGTIRDYLRRRLNKEIRVDPTTGFIAETDALEIEGGANAALRGALMAAPMASDVNFALSRTDNVLSTKTLTGDVRVVPLAYPETINVSVGFTNPAAKILAA